MAKVETVQKEGCKVGAINAVINLESRSNVGICRKQNALQERVGCEWSSGRENSLRLCAKSSSREPFERAGLVDFAFFLSHYIYLLIGWFDKSVVFCLW